MLIERDLPRLGLISFPAQYVQVYISIPFFDSSIGEACACEKSLRYYLSVATFLAAYYPFISTMRYRVSMPSLNRQLQCCNCELVFYRQFI